jgi:carboxypeptidase Taq
MTSYIKIADFYKKIKILKNVGGILHWDSSTMMPKHSFKARAEEMALLSSIQQKFLRSEQFGNALENIQYDDLDDWQKANIREMKSSRDNALAVETRLIELFTKATAEGKVVWEKARKDNNFQLFAPHLKKIISLARDIGKARQEYFKKDSAYDGLLDQYDKGSNQKDLDIIFSDLRKWLPSIISQVIDKQKPMQIIAFDQDFSVEKQKEFALLCMQKLGFDFNRGRIDTSTHPFCGGNAFDVRLTTRYDIKNFITGTLGVMHETGHALYNQNLPEDYKYQAVGEYRSIAIHESQSLFVEKHLGSSREFWDYITPQVHKTFKLSKANKAYSADNFYNINNKVESTFIRIDADEVTYPAHVILRYNLEKELIAGNLKVHDIPKVWNDGMKELLGITPKNDSEGCLQDIHWSLGAFGYFPTYLKGSIFAAQIANEFNKQDKNFKNHIKSGDWQKIISFLKDKVHSKASFLTSDELVKSVVGTGFDVEVYKQYLLGKFLR